LRKSAGAAAGEAAGRERGVPIFVCRNPIANLRDVWPELAGYY
jgi:hypothetical protein